MDFNIKDFVYPIQIIKLKFELDNTEKFNYTNLVEYQNQKLRDLITFSYNFIPYYRELFKKQKINPEAVKTLQDLSKIPVLTKEIVKERFDDLVCNKELFFKNKPMIYHTSGSTGKPLKFYHDKFTNISKFVFIWRMQEWCGYRIGKRFAIISTAFIKNNNIFNFKKLSNTLYISINKINKTNSLIILDELIKYKCKFLRGYPSSIFNFLRLIENNPKIKKLKLISVITYAENLSNFQRKYIESLLNVKVYNMYTQWEHVCLAVECESGNMHHQMENGILEILDKDNNVLGGGKSGEITATGFYNRTMPLIRYKLGDLGIKLKSECSCGRSHDIISGLDGRVSEGIITPDGRFINGLNTAVKFSTGFDSIQIIQNLRSYIDVKIVKNNSFSEEDIKILENNLRRFLGNEIKINFLFVSKIEASKNGKTKFVINNLKEKYF